MRFRFGQAARAYVYVKLISVVACYQICPCKNTHFVGKVRNDAHRFISDSMNFGNPGSK